MLLCMITIDVYYIHHTCNCMYIRFSFQRWLRLGSESGSLGSLNIIWPKGRDGHASCVLSDSSQPQVLVTGGWDKQNQLLYDAWVLDVTSGSWTEVSDCMALSSIKTDSVHDLLLLNDHYIILTVKFLEGGSFV